MTASKDDRSRSMLLVPLIIVAVSSFTFVFFLLKSLRASSIVTKTNINYFNLMGDGLRHLEPFECTQGMGLITHFALTINDLYPFKIQ